MILVLVSALLLILSFPNFSFWPCAWFAFVPIFFLTKRLERFSAAFFYFYLFGFIFFFVSLEWLRHVTLFGWAAVALIYAIYFALFGVGVHWFLNRRRSLVLSLFVLPAFWVVLEWIRTEVPDWSLGWNLLAYSQASQLPVATLARAIGAHGVSGLVLFANFTFFIFLDVLRTKHQSGVIALFIGFIFLTSVFGWHFNNSARWKSKDHLMDVIRAAIIQGNIPQEEKWDPKNKRASIEIHEKFTYLVSRGEDLDLVVWPEAAFPAYFNRDPLRHRVLEFQRELEVPLLLGSPYLEYPVEEREIAYNSAYLIDRKFSVMDRYDKIRLVAFGEYVPWRFLFGLLGLERFAYSLGVSDFEAGKEIKIFELDQKYPFSVLICFEDTFPSLARKAVQKGARFLVVITNDAWFGKSAAPYQHLQASIFRAIENGVPMIRAANTGVSAFISGRGEVIDRVKNQYGHDTFIGGGLVRSVALERGKTAYQRWGFQIPFYSLAITCVGFMGSLIFYRRCHRGR